MSYVLKWDDATMGGQVENQPMGQYILNIKVHALKDEVQCILNCACPYLESL